MNPNNEPTEKYIQLSQNNDNNNEEEEKPVHFKIEYDKNKYLDNQIESSPEIIKIIMILKIFQV